MKKYLIPVGLVFLIGIGLAIFFWPKAEVKAPVTQLEEMNNNPPPQPIVVPEEGKIPPVVAPESQADHLVEITTSGFWPKELIVKAGESVIWTNRDTKAHWIIPAAKNPYPEQGTCGSKLNSCSGIKLGESFKVIFAFAGTWKYSDKLSAKFPIGMVIVQ